VVLTQGIRARTNERSRTLRWIEIRSFALCRHVLLMVGSGLAVMGGVLRMVAVVLGAVAGRAVHGPYVNAVSAPHTLPCWMGREYPWTAGELGRKLDAEEGGCPWRTFG